MINPVAFKIFSKPITWYGIIIACAVLIGIFLALKESKRVGYDPDSIIDLILIAIPCAIIGARAYYVAFSWSDYANNFWHAFAIWEGGVAIYGAVIGGLIAALIYCRWKKVSFWLITDIVSPSLILGQAIGRWGNFFNQEAFGYAVGKSWQWFPAAVYIQQDQMWHMATFFYESAWDFIVFAILMFYRKKSRKQGNVFLMYLLLYSIGRVVVEGLRMDSLMLGNIRISQLLSGVLIILAGILLIRRKRAADEEEIASAEYDPKMRIMKHNIEDDQSESNIGNEQISKFNIDEQEPKSNLDITFKNDDNKHESDDNKNQENHSENQDKQDNKHED